MRALVFLLIGMPCTGNALAQALLQDPTRPANSAAYAAALPAAEPGQSGAQLQSVLHVPGRRPRALIDGQWIEQGQFLGDLRLVKVSGNSVILAPKAGGKGTLRQEILLTPGIEIARAVKEQASRTLESK